MITRKDLVEPALEEALAWLNQAAALARPGPGEAVPAGSTLQHMPSGRTEGGEGLLQSVSRTQ